MVGRLGWFKPAARAADQHKYVEKGGQKKCPNSPLVVNKLHWIIKGTIYATLICCAHYIMH